MAQLIVSLDGVLFGPRLGGEEYWLRGFSFCQLFGALLNGWTEVMIKMSLQRVDC